MKFSVGSVLLLCALLAGCSSTSDPGTQECVPGETVASSDLCGVCTCSSQGTIECAPSEIGTVCTPVDCCMVNATCQPCMGPDCPEVGMICQGQAALACGGESGCTISTPSCDEGECSCQDVSLPDGTACIDDPNACTAGDSCQAGACKAGELVDLEDGNPCTVGACVKGDVEQKALDGSCSDGNPCTLGDRCVLGQCLPESLVECAEEPCGQGICDPTAGSCVYESIADGTPCLAEGGCGGIGVCADGACAVEALSCEDNNPCTIDSCDATGTCAHGNQPDGTQCIDTASCIESGVCSAGFCVAEGQSPCVVDEPCKTALCGADGACDTQDAPDGTLCAQESACGTQAGVCSGGVCAFDGTLCDDNNSCTEDSCSDEGCVYAGTNEGGACGDDDPCNGEETCQAGVCTPGPLPSCTSASTCFIGSCAPGVGCVYVPDPDCDVLTFTPGKTVFFNGPDVISGLVPPGVTTAELHIWGGGAGGGFPSTGGAGAYVAASFPVAEGDVLELRVAGSSLSAGGGAGASYVSKNEQVLMIAAGGGGAGQDGCGGCTGTEIAGRGGAGGVAGADGEDGIENNAYSTGAGGGVGGSQFDGGFGGPSNDNSMYEQTSCAGTPGAVNEGGTSAQGTFDNPCQNNFAPASYEQGSANASNGAGGAGGAGFYGGGAGAGKWTYSGGGGGGGSSFLDSSIQLLVTEEGDGPNPGGMSSEHYENQAGAGGSAGIDSFGDPPGLGVSGMVVLILTP